MLLAAVGVLAGGPLFVLLVPLWGFFIAFRRPGWTVAYAISGLFVYLAVLQIGGEGPRTAITAMHYGIVAAVVLLTAWRGRPVMVGRLGSRSRLLTIWALAAGSLALWFSVNVVLLGRSETSYRFLALLILLTLPCVLALLGFGPTEFRQFREGLIFLGFTLVLAEAIAIARGADVEGGRLEAIAELDAISTSLVPALAVIALVALPASGARLWLQIAGSATLICGCLVAGTRGAAVSLAVTLVILALFAGKRVAVVACTAAALGGFSGIIASQLVGTATLAAVTEVVGIDLGDDPREAAPRSGGSGSRSEGSGSSGGLSPSAPEPISSLSMRRQWVRQSFEAFPESPLIGHGVARLENRTPEARRLGTFGERIWPHNDFAEATFSLGLLGLVPFLLLVAIPVYALVRLRRARSDAVVLLCGLFTFAFVQSNFSGEIGSDALLWASAAGLTATYADWRWGRRRAETTIRS